MGATDAFGTRAGIHFCGALVLAGVVTAPWPTLGSAGLVPGAVGYKAVVIRRVWRQTSYAAGWFD